MSTLKTAREVKQMTTTIKTSNFRAILKQRMGMASKVTAILPLLFLVFITVPFAYSGSLIATWDANAESDLAGYKLYYGPESSNYTKTIDVGDTTAYQVNNLTVGETYFFVVTAYDSSGNESAPSTEVGAEVQTPRLHAVFTGTSIRLNWASIQGADAYELYRSSNPFFTASSPIERLEGTTTFTDSDYPTRPDSGRYYILKALSGGSVLHEYNKVGVFNIGLNKSANLVSLPLIPDDSTLTSIIGTQLKGSTQSALSDKIYVWNGEGYEAAWLFEGGSGSLEGKWINMRGTAESTSLIRPDESFWIVLQSTSTDTILRVAGTVCADSQRVVTLAKGYSFIGISFPTEISLDASELAKDGVVTGSNISALADQIMAWKNNTFEKAWLYEDGNSEMSGKWLEMSGVSVSSMSFLPGQGYILWIQNDNPNNEWSYPNPNSNN